MRLETEDTEVVIIAKNDQVVVYASKDEIWSIKGTCNCCGLCEVGANNKYLVWTGIPVGQPGACLDSRFGHRKDIPVRPDIKNKIPNCTLSGQYLRGINV